MTVLREQITTSLPIGEAFEFVADFANSEAWDPGVAASRRLDGGPLGTGARFGLDVVMRGRTAPMEYRITTFEPPHRVILSGEGSGVRAIDDIRFEATATGTRIDYLADIRLQGLMRLAEPFAGAAFAKIGRDARDGMERTLEARARARAAVAGTAPAETRP